MPENTQQKGIEEYVEELFDEYPNRFLGHSDPKRRKHQVLFTKEQLIKALTTYGEKVIEEVVEEMEDIAMTNNLVYSGKIKEINEHVLLFLKDFRQILPNSKEQ